MEDSKIKKHIIIANNSKLKYISLISLGFSGFVLSTDFLVHGVWRNEYLYFYKVLDIIFTIISISAVSFFWLFKIKNFTLQKAGIILFPFFILIWSAVITGTDFSFLGFSTFLIVVLSVTFFLYINLVTSIVYFASSYLSLILTLYFRGELNDNYLPVIFLVFPTIIISILITARNYKSKLNDLFNNERMAEMNMKLQYSNQHLEKEIEKRTREILLALEKAKESDRLKSAFLANVSHEIRTPLNGILGFAEILKEQDLSGEQQQEYLSIIEKSSARMLNTINDIVDLSKIESGQIKVSVSEINVNKLIKDIYAFFKPEAEQKGLQIRCKNALPANEAIIITDKDKLFDILSNLIKNAIKFTNSGSIEIGYNIVEASHAETLHATSLMEFYVCDTGIGIPPDQLEFIFERFRQGSESLNKKFQGSGLGLAISKAYVEILGGKIWVESEVGKGSVFYFTIPTVPELKEESFFKNVVLPNGTESLIRNLKILIAEDDDGSAIFLKVAVRMFSKEVIRVRTGIEAIESCHNNPDFDLVMMDIQMPEMDGLEATRQIRKFNTDVVIIAQTAFALSGDNEKVIEAGCNDYISKPIKKELLMELIQRHFKN